MSNLKIFFTSEKNGMKILGIGNALVDVLIQLESYELLNELRLPKGSMQLIGIRDIPEISGKINHLPAIMQSGGSAANTIHGLAGLGAACGYIGKIGKDELGQFYENDLHAAGIYNILYKSDTETGRAYTFITPDSERTFATYLGAAVELQDSEIGIKIFKSFDILHVEGYLVQNKQFIEKSLCLAKESGLKISLDLASYNVVESNHDFLSRIIPQYVDILFANEEEAKAYTRKDPAEALPVLAQQTDIAVVKLGKQGSLIQKGEHQLTVTIDPVDAIDTTGAGDQYAAGFLFGYMNHIDLEKCGQLGSLLSAAVVENYGARIPAGSWPEIINSTKSIIKK
jgi:sugar/nucleoside kinase (ribokinase family)